MNMHFQACLMARTHEAQSSRSRPVSEYQPRVLPRLAAFICTPYFSSKQSNTVYKGFLLPLPLVHFVFFAGKRQLYCTGRRNVPLS